MFQVCLFVVIGNVVVLGFMTHMGSKMSFLDRLYNVVFFYCSKVCFCFLFVSKTFKKVLEKLGYR